MSKTRVNRKIPSSEILILRHSKARVLLPSGKRWVRSWTTLPNGVTVPKEMSRELSTPDVVVALSRKYGK